MPKSVGEGGTRETEVRLDGWCEGGLRQQRNYGGGSAAMRERLERVESPGTYVITERVSRGHFNWPCVLPDPLPCPDGYHMEMGVMPLHDAVGINFKKGPITENQGSGVRYMG